MMRYAVILGAVLLAGCMETRTPDVGVTQGARLFAVNCTMCHGADARGGGPLAAQFETAPPDLTRIAARRDGVWPSLEIMAILDGYARRTRPRDDMPVLPVLTDGDLVNFDPGNGRVTRVPRRLIAVADYLESVQNPAPSGYVP